MQVEIERREAGEVELKISMEPQAVATEIERVFKEISKSVQIPGFRPGHAPRTMIESRINMELVKTEALEHLAQTGYVQALAQTGLIPLDKAKVEDEKLQDDGSFTFKATVAVVPDVKLGEYKGLKVTKPNVPVTDDAVDKELESLRMRFMTFTSQPEKAIESGDIAIIDYEVEVDGKIAADAGVKGYPLEVGADTLFPELNEGLAGAKVGEERRIQSKLPEAHPNSEIAGKEATFVVNVKDLKTRTLPDFDDEFAKRFGEVENMEQLRNRMREILEKAATRMADQAVRDRLISQVVDASEVELPQVMIDREIEDRESEIIAELERHGMELDNYLAQQGWTYESWKKELEQGARESIKRYLTLQEIEKQEDISVSDEEIAAEIEHLAMHDKTTPAAKRHELETNDRLDDVLAQIRREKTVQLLVESAEVTLEEPIVDAAAEAPTQEVDTEAAERGKE